MKKDQSLNTKTSEPEQVETYMRTLKHPLKKVAEQLRASILGSDPSIGEEIKWNTPAFFYAGQMAPFDPKKHKRHVAVLNFFKKDCIRVVFPSGASMGDTTGLLKGDYADGRRIAMFASFEEVKAKEGALQQAIKRWLGTLSQRT